MDRTHFVTLPERLAIQRARKTLRSRARKIQVTGYERALYRIPPGPLRRSEAWRKVDTAIFSLCSDTDLGAVPITSRDRTKARAALSLLSDTFGV